TTPATRRWAPACWCSSSPASAARPERRSLYGRRARPAPLRVVEGQRRDARAAAIGEPHLALRIRRDEAEPKLLLQGRRVALAGQGCGGQAPARGALSYFEADEFPV